MKKFDTKEKIYCRICGKLLSMISYSHLKTHGITIKEYKIKFPNAPLWSDKQRKNKSDISKGQIRKSLSQEQKERISKAKKAKNLKLSDEHKKKISKASKAMWQDPEIRERILASNQEYWTDEVRKEWSKKIKQQYIDHPEIKEKLKKTEKQKKVASRQRKQYYKDHPEAIKRGKDNPMFGIPKTKEQKEAQSKLGKRLWANPEYKEKMKKKHQDRYAKWTDKDREDWSKKMSKAQSKPGVLERKNKAIKEAWSDPERRRIRSELLKEIWKNPELKKHRRKLTSDMWKDPAYKKRMSKMFKKMWEDEDFRERMSRMKRGSATNFWIHGKSSWPYTNEWTAYLKRTIRIRDGKICQSCGKGEEKEKSHVHHIDYNKENCNSRNLICLCRSCHSIVRANRWFWEEYFKRIMDIRFFPPESTYP